MSELIFFTNTSVTFDAGGATAMAYKKAGAAVSVISAVNGIFTLNTGTDTGRYKFQTTDQNGNIIDQGEFQIQQDLAHAATSFDPRSDAEKTLEALDARIAGRALTIQQTSITVDGRSIQYMNSIDELLKWRDYFARIVAKEKGHGDFDQMVCVLRRA